MSAAVAQMAIDAAFAVMASAMCLTLRKDSSIDDAAQALMQPITELPEQDVSQEDTAPLKAAGIMFIEPTGSVLMLMRSGEGDHSGEWCFPGGKMEDGETAEQAAMREAVEEIGMLPKGDRVLLTRRIADGVDFSTFMQLVPEKFIPTLNEEHIGFLWFDPRPDSNALSARRDAGYDPGEARNKDGEWTSGESVDIGNTTVFKNPSKNDLAKMFESQQSGGQLSLRASTEGDKFAVWPATEELHQTVQRALKLSDKAHRWMLYARPTSGHTPGDTSFNVGRYSVRVESDQHTGSIDPKYLPSAMKRVFGVRDSLDRSDAGFDPSEARDTHGEWTEGGGSHAAVKAPAGTQTLEGPKPPSGQPSGGAMFVSPSLAGETDLAAVIKHFNSPRHKQFVADADAINTALGVKSHSASAIGAWKDGAENALFQEVDSDTDLDTLKIAVSMQGLIAQQKAAIAFKAGAGPDEMYTFTVHQPMEKVHADLLKMGVEFHTLIGSDSGDTKVAVVDFGAELSDKMEAVGEHFDVGIESHTGTGAYIGDDESRDKGAIEYNKVIESYNQAHPGSTGFFEGIHDRWRKFAEAENKPEVTAQSLLEKSDDPKATEESIMSQFEPEVREQVKEAEANLAKAVPTDASVAQGGFMTPDGHYTPEREALHDKWIREILSPEAIKRAKPPPGTQPTYVILGGRGGAGKSQLTREGGPVDANKFIVFDNDKIKEKIPEYKGWNAAMVHEEATHVFELAERQAREAGLNVVHDATMKTTKNAEAFAKKYKDAGYRVEGYYMYLSPQMAAKRAVERFVRAGRFVPPSYVLGSRSNEATFDKLKPLFDKWGLYDNSGNHSVFVASGGKDTGSAGGS